MAHEPSLATRAWAIAHKHIPHFETLATPARKAILAAVTEALRSGSPAS